MSLSRRQVLSLIWGIALTPAARCAESGAEPEGDLSLTALHSGETVHFRIRGRAPQDAMTRERIEHVLRDRRTGGTREMDPGAGVRRAAPAAGRVR